MNIERFIAKRILLGSGASDQLSRPIVRISVLGITLGLAVMILSVAIVTGFQNEIKAKLIGFNSHIQVTYYDNNVSSEPKPISKIQPFLKDLKSDPNINHIEVYAIKNGIVKTQTDNEGILLKGISADYDWTFLNKNFVQGKGFALNDTVSKSIVISKYLSDKLNLKLNDKMIIYFIVDRFDSLGTKLRTEASAKDFYISGIYETGLEDVDKMLVLSDIRRIQKMNGWREDQVAGFEISIKDYRKIDEAGADVDAMIGQGLVAQTIKQTNPTIFSWLDMMDINANIILVLMVIVAAINMMSALLILILERTNMIGILKAMGAKNGSVQKIFLYNAIYLIGKGMLYGNIVGISIALIQQHFGLFTLDAKIYYISQIPINLNILHILFLNLGIFVCCFLMLIIPSFIVSKITPVKAIRFS
ncbi:MAG: ABC transporter permease [Bacteroidetes bacterium]|nr:ABC transporter permease [Bacteroidota bacterium]